MAKKIVLDPGHGDSAAEDRYRKGPSGEREEWINLRVAKCVEALLKEKLYDVTMTRTEDVKVELSERVKIGEQGDLFLSIHHNASNPVDRKLDYPCVFMHGSVQDSKPSKVLAETLAHEFSITKRNKAYIFSDKLIFEEGMHVLREMPTHIPAVISEFSFFSEPFEEKELKKQEYCERVAHSYVRGIEEYFKAKTVKDIIVWKEVFFDPQYRRKLAEIRADLMAKPDRLSAVDYGLSAQQHFNLGNTEFAGKEIDKSLALLSNGPYLQPLLELGIQIAESIEDSTKQRVLTQLHEHAVIEIFSIDA